MLGVAENPKLDRPGEFSGALDVSSMLSVDFAQTPTSGRLNLAESMKRPSCRELTTMTGRSTDFPNHDPGGMPEANLIRELVNHLNVGIYKTTPGREGRFIFWNQALLELFGYTEEEMRLLPVRSVYADGADRDDFEASMIASERVRNRPIRLKRKDGVKFYGEITAVTLRDASGQISAYMGSVHDATTAVEVYEGFSHQIGTPLVAVMHSATRIMNDNKANQKARLLAKSILGCSQTSLFLTRNLNFMAAILDLSRPAFQELAVPLMISPLIHRLVIQLQEYARQEKTVEIKVESQQLDRVGMLRTEEKIFTMLCYCLLDNAIKYAFEDTTVRIYVEEARDNIHLIFENEGMELYGRDLERIFERRYRTNEARSLVPAGSGLGLYFAQEIMKLHRGKVVPEPSKNLVTRVRLLFPRMEFTREYPS